MRHKRAVYFIRSNDAIKIGCTTHLKGRLAQIERDIENRVELIGWIFGSFKTEKLIHKSLSNFADGNEWFSDCPEVRNLISYLLSKGPIFQGLPHERLPARVADRR